MLLYHDDGSYTCLIDRGGVNQQAITDSSVSNPVRADFVCIAAGPAKASAALLAGVPDDVPVAWIAKRDPDSFPAWLTRRLARRADLIFCNTSERPMVDSSRSAGTRPGQAIIETRGADGVLLERSGHKLEMPCETVRARDATGAGDTLAGEVIATLLSGITDLETALRRGMDAARSLLLTRAR